MKKRLFPILLAIVMSLSLLPVSAMAEAGDWGVSPTAPKNFAGTVVGTKDFKDDDTLLIGEDGNLQAMPILNDTYNAMAYCGATATSSNDSILEVKQNGENQDIVIGTWAGGAFDGADCLQVNVNAKKVGTVTVTIDFYYTFSQNGNPFTNSNAQWIHGTFYYTVTVVDPDANKPGKPTISDLERFRNYVNTTSSSKGAVYMWCSKSLYDHGAWFSYLTDVDNEDYPDYPDAYTLGDVVANDGSVLSKTTYPWICVMTLNGNTWLAEYNNQLAKTCGTHYLEEDQPATEMATWYYNASLRKWQFRSSEAPVYFDITHTDPAPTPTPDDITDTIITDEVVTVKCKTEDTTDPDETYKLKPESLTIPKVALKDEDGYYVDVKVAADLYVKDYSDAHGTHELVNPKTSPQTIRLRYNSTTKKWSVEDSDDLIFEVKHEVKNPPAAPDAELDALVTAAKVYVNCDSDPSHAKDSYELTKHSTHESTKNGTVVTYTIDHDAYAADYKPGEKTHTYRKNDNEVLTVTFVWEKDPTSSDYKWTKKGSDAQIWTTCPEDQETTVNVVIKPVDSTGNEIDGALVRSTDFGTVNTTDNRFHVGYLTTTQTLSEQSGDGLENSEPVKTFVYQQMAKGDETWHPADGVEQEFTWARQIRFTDLKEESDGTYTLTGQIIFYKLTLDLDGGKLNSGDTAVTYYLSGSEATLPEPSKTGYTFAGWEYKEEDPGDGGVIAMSANEQDNDPPAELYPAGTKLEMTYDEEYIARWTVNQYTITFDTDGGTKIDPITQDYGTPVTRPANPTKSGYTFVGWDKTIPSTMPAENMTITALWKSNTPSKDDDNDDDYTLKYVTNGGKVISSETKSRSWVKDYEDLPTPTRSGYRFEGWYYDTRLTDKVTGDVKVNRTMVTLYARWASSETPGMLNDEDHFAYVQGYSDGNVRPYGLISRAETTTIFFRLLTDEVRDDNLLTSNTYTDVTGDYWANTAISTMTGLGIVQGRSATTFDPNAPITRAQFAAICARFDTGVSSGTRTFSDISGHWAEKYIERAAELGWIQGFEDGTFRPDTYITRAQAMTMINRVLNRTPVDAEDLLDGMKTWPDCNPGDWFYLAVQEATNSHDYKDQSGEVWTKLTRDPDWTRYER